MFGLVAAIRTSADDGTDIRALHATLTATGRAAGRTETALFHERNVVVSAFEPDLPSATPTPSKRFHDGISLALFGVIYNDFNAGESSLDFVHRTYLANGTDCFRELNGTFSLVLFDPRANKVYAAVDRLSTRPLLYAQTEEHVLLSPDLRSFTDSGQVPRRLNPHALASMLGSRHMYGSDTYVEGVRSINAGCFLEVQGETAKEKRYWDYTIEPDEDRGMDAYRVELRDLILSAMDRRLRKCPEPALFLSGGIDSRAMLGVARELGHRVHLYAYEEGDQSGSDPEVAKRVAKSVGMELNPLQFSSLDLERRIRETTPTFNGMREGVYEHEGLRKLRGQHRGMMVGDESWGGRGFSMETEEDFLLSMCIARLNTYPTWKEMLSDGLYESLVECDTESFDRLHARCSSVDIHDRKDYFSTMERLPRKVLLGRTFISGHIGELLLPWLDNDILDLIRRTPTRYRMGRLLFDETIFWMYPDLFAVPTATRQGGVRDWDCMRHALSSGSVDTLCFGGEYSVDSLINRESLRNYLESTRPTRMMSLKERVKTSDSRVIQSGTKWISSKLKSNSSAYTRNLMKSYAITPWRVMESIAWMRFTLGDQLGLELDEPALLAR